MHVHFIFTYIDINAYNRDDANFVLLISNWISHSTNCYCVWTENVIQIFNSLWGKELSEHIYTWALPGGCQVTKCNLQTINNVSSLVCLNSHFQLKTGARQLLKYFLKNNHNKNQ